MNRTWRLVAEIAAWSLFVVPVAVFLTARRLLGHGRDLSAEERADALLAWYPARWRERHGAELRQLLLDTMADGRGDLRMSIDVAREGVIERARELRWDRIRASVLLTLGWIMFFPQGIVAAVLGLIPGMPQSWFVALYADGAERWLVAGGMVSIGLLLLDRGLQLLAADCAARKSAKAAA